MTIPETDTSPENGKSPLYYISLDRLAQLGRSPVYVLAERRGPSAPSRLKADSELDDPKDLINEIAEYSVKEQDFIRSDMPLQEMYPSREWSHRTARVQYSDFPVPGQRPGDMSR